MVWEFNLKEILPEFIKSRQRLIFISHKFKDNPTENRQMVDKICHYWYRKGYIPISPLHLFSYMDDDRDRKIVMAISKALILLCPTVAVYHQSEGCREEEKFALKHNKKVLRFYEEITEEDIEYIMTHPKDIRIS
jgi:hypothetical protein